MWTETGVAKVGCEASWGFLEYLSSLRAAATGCLPLVVWKSKKNTPPLQAVISQDIFGVRIGVFYDFRSLFSAKGQQPIQNSWPLLAGVLWQKILF